MAVNDTYLRDGDVGFIGLNSRDNPVALPKGYVSKSVNFRLDRGVATVRKGLKRKTTGSLIGTTIYGIGIYLDSTGQEIFVVASTDGLYTYNPQTEIVSSKISYPAGETITTQIGCDVVFAVDKVFITRGWAKRPLVWDMGTGAGSVTVLPTGSGAGHTFPSANGLLYYANRLIALGKNVTESNTARNRDTVCVSNYLDYQNWDTLDAFTFNNGGNDEVISVCPWTLNEFLVFMRNSVFYVNIGLGRYGYSDQLGSDSFIKTLVTDIGCSARKSVVQANGGVIFLSDNGVYFLEPQSVGSNESIRLLTLADPISANIDDVIQRINKEHSYKAVATYWNNRYYLAVPLDDSTDNNVVLVYNFILKAWESVDTYPAGFDIMSFCIAKKDNRRRLYSFDSDRGLFMMEELDWDEFTGATGTPLLPFFLPATLNPLSFTPVDIEAELITRRYIFETFSDKRFSTAEIDMYVDAGAQVETTAIISNPDVETNIDKFGSPNSEDVTRCNPIRKIGTGLQLLFDSNHLRPSIRSAFVYATPLKKNNVNKK